MEYIYFSSINDAGKWGNRDFNFRSIGLIKFGKQQKVGFTDDDVLYCSTSHTEAKMFILVQNIILKFSGQIIDFCHDVQANGN